MMHIAKLIFYLLRELIFDNKDEYNFKSSKFNTRKFIVLILVCLSLVCNVWLGYRFVTVAKALISTKHQLEKQCQVRLPATDLSVQQFARSGISHWIPASRLSLFSNLKDPS